MKRLGTNLGRGQVPGLLGPKGPFDVNARPHTRQSLLVFVPQRRHLEEEDDFCSIPKIRLIPSSLINLTLEIKMVSGNVLTEKCLIG